MKNTCFWVFRGQIIYLISCHTSNIESFYICYTSFTIFIYHIVDCSRVSFFKNSHMFNSFFNEFLIFHSAYNHITSLRKNYNVINIRTLFNIFFFSKRCSYKTFQSIYIKSCISYNHFFNINIIENFDFCFSNSILPVL